MTITRITFLHTAHPDDEPAFHATPLTKSKNLSKYAYYCDAEIFGLLESEVLSFLPRKEADGYRLYKIRFCDLMKNEGLPTAFEKCRYVVMTFNDNNHAFLTHAPTVQLYSVPLLVTLAACDETLIVYTRDVFQAYTQSKTKLSRPIYVEPPSILNCPPGLVIHLGRPLYGILEAGTHWFFTHHPHHIEILNMMAGIHDQCVLYSKYALNYQPDSQPRGAACPQTDDTLHAINVSFRQKRCRS